jgi:hypothetical protein
MNGKEQTKAATAACMNWAGDPCQACGKYPLSIHNVTGFCRKCGRRRKNQIYGRSDRPVSWRERFLRRRAKKGVR